MAHRGGRGQPRLATMSRTRVTVCSGRAAKDVRAGRTRRVSGRRGRAYASRGQCLEWPRAAGGGLARDLLLPPASRNAIALARRAQSRSPFELLGRRSLDDPEEHSWHPRRLLVQTHAQRRVRVRECWAAARRGGRGARLETSPSVSTIDGARHDRTEQLRADPRRGATDPQGPRGHLRTGCESGWPGGPGATRRVRDACTAVAHHGAVASRDQRSGADQPEARSARCELAATAASGARGTRVRRDRPGVARPLSVVGRRSSRAKLESPARAEAWRILDAPRMNGTPSCHPPVTLHA
jgi:hypothetical protein